MSFDRSLSGSWSGCAGRTSFRSMVIWSGDAARREEPVQGDGAHLFIVVRLGRCAGGAAALHGGRAAPHDEPTPTGLRADAFARRDRTGSRSRRARMDPPPAPGTPATTRRHARRGSPPGTDVACKSPNAARAPCAACAARFNWPCTTGVIRGTGAGAVRSWKPGACGRTRSSLRQPAAARPSPSAPAAPAPRPPNWPPSGVCPWTTPPCTRWRKRRARAPRSKPFRRLETPAPETEPQRAPSQLAVLMIDGCRLRYRGPGWGQTRPREPRVQWHELQARRLLPRRTGRANGGRTRAPERQTHREPAGRGDGAGPAPAFGGAGRRAGPGLARAQRQRRGNAAKLLKELGTLAPPGGEEGEVVRREQNYFAQHAARMNYRELSQSGPIGSGAVESACRQRQCRFKRAGQFWTEDGMKHLCPLQEARRNDHWEELWTPSSQPR